MNGEGDAGAMGKYSAERGAMVAQQLASRGISDPRVLAAMERVPRHLFVSGDLEKVAYTDHPLPIGHGQTISQPYMVALATALTEPRPTDHALEIGAGCGYQAAVLSELCARVHAIEVVPALADKARAHLQALGKTNVEVGGFDGSGGWPEHGPYDVIIVSAGAPRVPALLAAQLADGGRMVIPVGPPGDQVLTRIQRKGDEFVVTTDTACRYVDLVGRYGVGSRPATS